MTRLLIGALALLSACAPEPADVTPDLETDDQVSDPAAEAAAEAVDRLDGLEVDGTTMARDLEGGPVASALTTDGGVELGVTDRVIYARLSAETQEETLAEVRRETEDGSEDGSELGAQIGRAVAGALEAGLAVAAQVPLEDVAAVRVRDGRLLIEMADGGPSPFSSSTVGDRPLLESFAPADAERIARAFDRVK